MTDIRAGRSADLSRLHSIQRRTLAESWPELLETAVEGQPPLFVIEDDQPIGYAIAITDTERVVYLPEIAVHPDRQGEGHGSRLLHHLFEEYDEYQECRLTVEAADERARRFYERHGFELLERLEDNFESGDGLLVAREL